MDNIILGAADFNAQQLLRQANGESPLLCICHQCEPGHTWECDQCKREMPWCLGTANDEDPETCNECWGKMQRLGSVN